MPSVYIKTYGCQMNERDRKRSPRSSWPRVYARAVGGGGGVILLNTCSVRDMAEQKAIGKMQILAAEVRATARSGPRVHGLHGAKPGTAID